MQSFLNKLKLKLKTNKNLNQQTGSNKKKTQKNLICKLNNKYK